jgi:hypothetical protein
MHYEILRLLEVPVLGYLVEWIYIIFTYAPSFFANLTNSIPDTATKWSIGLLTGMILASVIEIVTGQVSKNKKAEAAGDSPRPTLSATWGHLIATAAVTYWMSAFLIGAFFRIVSASSPTGDPDRLFELAYKMALFLTNGVVTYKLISFAIADRVQVLGQPEPQPSGK